MNNLFFYTIAVMLIAGNLLVGGNTTLSSDFENLINSKMTIESSPRDTICEGLGCEDGKRKCAEPTAKVTIGYLGTGLEMEVKFYCYDKYPT